MVATWPFAKNHFASFFFNYCFQLILLPFPISIIASNQFCFLFQLILPPFPMFWSGYLLSFDADQERVFFAGECNECEDFLKKVNLCWGENLNSPKQTTWWAFKEVLCHFSLHFIWCEIQIFTFSLNIRQDLTGLLYFFFSKCRSKFIRFSEGNHPITGTHSGISIRIVTAWMFPFGKVGGGCSVKGNVRRHLEDVSVSVSF